MLYTQYCYYLRQYEFCAPYILNCGPLAFSVGP